MGSPGVLVLGGEGMLGQGVSAHLANRGLRVSSTQHSDPSAPRFLDATSETAAWRSLMAESGCAYAVNCIGVLNRAMSDDVPWSIERGIRVNAVFPHTFARVAGERGMRVIHMSTDGVFAPGTSAPHLECDPLDCTDHYGKSKALGECSAANVLNIRCSIIGVDSRKHKGLLEWVLQQPEGERISGFQDEFWNGVSTLQFARLCERVICEDCFERFRNVSPVHHFCPNPLTTKYELLRVWCAVAKKRVTVCPVNSTQPRSRVLGTGYGCIASLLAEQMAWHDILSELTR